MSVWVAVLGLWGCADPSAPPLVEAHRAAAGYWPANSRAAVQGSIAADFDGLEVDLVLTADGHAVLSHDPWLDPSRCTTDRGKPLAGRVRIDEVRLRKLQSDYLCGGIPDAEHPGAEVLPEPVLSFDELLDLLQGASAGMRVHLDLKVEPGWTPPAEQFLEPILDAWWAADLPQELVVTANTPATLALFEDHARARDRDLRTALIWPRFPVGASSTAVGLEAERDLLLGRVDYIALIEEAGADGIAVQHEVAERGALQVTRRAGYETALWTVNAPRDLASYARWPVDVIITDYPTADR